MPGLLPLGSAEVWRQPTRALGGPPLYKWSRPPPHQPPLYTPRPACRGRSAISAPWSGFRRFSAIFVWSFLKIDSLPLKPPRHSRLWLGGPSPPAAYPTPAPVYPPRRPVTPPRRVPYTGPGVARLARGAGRHMQHLRHPPGTPTGSGETPHGEVAIKIPTLPESIHSWVQVLAVDRDLGGSRCVPGSRGHKRLAEGQRAATSSA